MKKTYCTEQLISMNVIYMYCKILILKKITMERGKDHFLKNFMVEREKRLFEILWNYDAFFLV